MKRSDNGHRVFIGKMLFFLFLAVVMYQYGFTSWSGSLARENTLSNYHVPLRSLISSMRCDTAKLRIYIDKSDYKLTVFHEKKVVKSYPVVFGFNPVDDKLREGDRCTPEGRFKMISKYPHASWKRFIWFDYPNQESWKKHNAAKKRGKIPADAKIGGEVGIHGVPEGYDDLIDRRENWTLGCVALKNKDIIEIYPYINTETRIEIAP